MGAAVRVVLPASNGLCMTGLLSPNIVIKILVQFVLLSFMYPGHGVTHQVAPQKLLHMPGCSLGIALLMLAIVKTHVITLHRKLHIKTLT